MQKHFSFDEEKTEMADSTKYIFVTGGVVSGLGKGITAASLGRLLKERGFRVTNQKLDPYLNVDPGMMNPLQHGEVFVTDDGAETDLDLGHYERFTDENLTVNSSVTSGKVYWDVLNRERRGDYLGGTVQIIPHITNEIKEAIHRVSGNADIVITEIGGTVGDIESLPFLEAIRQFSLDIGRENCVFVHVTLIPYLSASEELKSKPTQHSVKQLLALGIRPHILVCRSEQAIPVDMRSKISMFCDVRVEDIIENRTVDTLYQVPLMLEQEGMADAVCHHLGIRNQRPSMSEWHRLVDTIQKCDNVLCIALVGKYVDLHDAYLSIAESLNHAGYTYSSKINIRWVNAEDLTPDNIVERLDGVHGILVPGGFGMRGTEGKILAAGFARTRNVPFFGICLGMHMAAVEFARNVLGLSKANSSEFDADTPDPIFHIVPSQLDAQDRGSTMRLGIYPCILAHGSKVSALYGSAHVSERHRHRYEFNNDYRKAFTENGVVLGGVSPDNTLVDIIELEDHPWFVGVQFHPEFKSRPNRPHPLFKGFIGAAVEYQRDHRR